MRSRTSHEVECFLNAWVNITFPTYGVKQQLLMGGIVNSRL